MAQNIFQIRKFCFALHHLWCIILVFELQSLYLWQNLNKIVSETHVA